MPSTSADSAHVVSIAAASSGRADDAITSPGMSRSTPDRVVVVEVAAEPALVAVAGDADDHPVPVRPLREELQRRRLAAQLILGVVEVREVLDLGDRQEPADGRAERESEDRRLVEQRVEHAPRAEARVQPARHAVDAALDGDVLTEEERVRMTLEHRREPGVDRLRERERLVPCKLDARSALSATTPGERGASGAITCSADDICGSAATSSATSRTSSRAAR